MWPRTHYGGRTPDPSTDLGRQTSALPHRLSARELEVAALICRGEKTDAIAWALGISSHTVKAHRARIYLKLGVNSAAELALAMARSPAGAAALDRLGPALM